MQYMKVNQFVSQRPIFSFKAKFPDEHNNNTRGGGVWHIYGCNAQLKTSMQTCKIIVKTALILCFKWTSINHGLQLKIVIL